VSGDGKLLAGAAFSCDAALGIDSKKCVQKFEAHR
jgi:hypothetical protein